MNRPAARRRFPFVAAGILAALLAATLRGPCRHAVPRVDPAHHAAPLPSCGAIARVLDGDTVVTETGDVVRIIGLDAPEVDSADPARAAAARRATAFLTELVAGKRVRLVYDVEPHDRYGRILAHLMLAGPAGDLLAAEELLRRGLASIYLVPPNLQNAETLVAAQRQAVEAGRGVWSLPVTPEASYVIGAYRFHRPWCPHAREIPRPRVGTDRTAILRSGKGPCRYCRP